VLFLLYLGTIARDSRGEVSGFRTGLQEATYFAEKLLTRIAVDGRHPYGRVMTAFLNHDVGGTWSSPSFKDAGRLLQENGAANVVFFRRVFC
jgi:ferrochelatase